MSGGQTVKQILDGLLFMMHNYRAKLQGVAEK